MCPSITVRLNNEEADLLESLKNSLNITTGSKVILYVLNNFPDLRTDLKNTTNTLLKTQNRLKTFERAIRNKQSAEIELDNLLNNKEVN